MRRRLPLFDVSVGTTLDTLMVDKLHCLYLGPAQTWCHHALWRLILVDAFGVGGTAIHHYPLAVSRIKGMLWTWYRAEQRRRPDEQITQVQNFTIGLLGNTATSLATKAAETKWLLPFVLSLVERFGEKFSHVENECLRDSGRALQEYIDLLDAAPRIVPMPALERMCYCVKAYIDCCHRGNIPLKPKAHMLVHMALRTLRHGNPNEYAVFTDESINRTLAKIAEAAHRSVWEVRAFASFREAERVRKRKTDA